MVDEAAGAGTASAHQLERGTATDSILATVFAIALGATFAMGVANTPAAQGGLQWGLAAWLALLGWPLIRFAFWCGRRIGLAPAPLAAGKADVGGSRRRIVPGVVMGWAVLSAFVGGLVLWAFTARRPDIAWGQSPLADVTGLQILVMNLLVVSEEIVFRLILLYPLAALLGVRQAVGTRQVSGRAWVAIVIAALLFGAIHYPGLGGIPGMSGSVWMAFILIQKGLVAGVAFGYVGWRWGLEAAILTHYAHNLVLFNVDGLFG